MRQGCNVWRKGEWLVGVEDLVDWSGTGQEGSSFFAWALRDGGVREDARHVKIKWFVRPVVEGKRRGWILRGMELRLSGRGGRKEGKRLFVRGSV